MIELDDDANDNTGGAATAPLTNKKRARLGTGANPIDLDDD